jgi:MFS family permease
MPSPSNSDHGQPWSAPLRRVRHWFAAGTDGTNRQQRKLYPLNFWFCVFVLFLTKLGSELLAYPWPRLLVTAICRHYYQDEDGHHGDPSNEFCADERVMSHWISMTRLIQFISPLAATVALIPMGMLLDKGKGRLAFTISIFSTALYWGSIAIFGFVPGTPLWCFYISPIFLLLGGGPWAINALVYATLSSTVRPEQRTAAFSFLQGLSGIPGLVGPLLYAASMSLELWVPFALALIIYSFTLLPALHLKNNNNQHDEDNETRDEMIPDETQPLLNAGSDSAREAIHLDHSGGRGLSQKLHILTICFACFFGFYLARGAVVYTTIWVWSRFGHDALYMNVFIYIEAVVLSILFLIALPLTIHKLDKNWRVSKRDAILSLTSIGCCAVGTFILLVSPNLATAIIGFIMAMLGNVMPISLRSFLASHFAKDFSGRLFAGIAIAETIGGLVGQPLMTVTYYTEGIPFFISLVTYLIMILLLVRLAIRL